MKKLSGIVKAGALILFAAAILMVSACGGEENLNPADKTALNEKISEAEAAIDGIQQSEDGENIPLSDKWVTQAEYKALSDAIAAAKDVYNNKNATKNQVENAVKKISDLLRTWNPQFGKQTPQDGLNRTALMAKISTVETALGGAEISDAGIFADNWVTQAEYDELNRALEDAVAVASKLQSEGNTQAAIDAAVSALDSKQQAFVPKPEVFNTAIAFRVNAAGTGWENKGSGGSAYSPAAYGDGEFKTVDGFNVFDTRGYKDGQWKYHWWEGFWDRYINVGYVDLGASTGGYIAAAANWSIETIFALPSTHPDAVIDQFVWSFADSAPLFDDLLGFNWRELYMRVWTNTSIDNADLQGWTGDVFTAAKTSRDKAIGLWAHVVVTKNGDMMTVYVNGQKAHEKSHTWPVYTADDLTHNYLGKTPHPGRDAIWPIDDVPAGTVNFGMDMPRTGFYHFAIDNSAWNQDTVTTRYNNGPVGKQLLTSWTGSESTNPPVDKSTLIAAIAAAEAALNSYDIISENGLDVEQNLFWVTEAAYNTFIAAIDTAKAIRAGSSTTAEQAAAAAGVLTVATTTFSSAIQEGKKATVFTALTDKISDANAAKENTVVNTDAANVDIGKYFVLEAVMTTFNTAISDAQTVANNTSAKQAAVDAAVITLNNAITVFNAAKASGTKAPEDALNRTALLAKIDEVETALTNAENNGLVCEYNAGVYKTNWVGRNDWSTLNTALGTARTDAGKEAGAGVWGQSNVDTATSTLNTALTAFTAAFKTVEGYDTVVAYRVNAAGNGWVNIGTGGAAYTAAGTQNGVFTTSGGLKVYNTKGTYLGGNWSLFWWDGVYVHGGWNGGQWPAYKDVGVVNLGEEVGKIFGSTDEWTVETIFALPRDWQGEMVDQFAWLFTDTNPEWDKLMFGLQKTYLRAQAGWTHDLAQAHNDHWGQVIEGVRANYIGNWAHVVVTKDASDKVTIYINGTITGEATVFAGDNGPLSLKNPLLKQGWLGKNPYFDPNVPLVNETLLEGTSNVTETGGSFGMDLANTGYYHFAVAERAWSATEVAARHTLSPVGGSLKTWTETLAPVIP